MNWKRMFAYVTGSVDQELLRRIEYLVIENRILRDQIKGRVRLSNPERISLAENGKRLGKAALEEVAQIVRPETILGWHRKLVAQKFDGSQNRLSTVGMRNEFVTPSALLLSARKDTHLDQWRCPFDLTLSTAQPLSSLWHVTGSIAKKALWAGPDGGVARNGNDCGCTASGWQGDAGHVHRPHAQQQVDFLVVDGEVTAAATSRTKRIASWISPVQYRNRSFAV
jgi:hypothetical protein